MESDLLYCRRRLREEIAAAGAATNPRVSAVHMDLARRYDARIRAAEAARRQAALHLVGAA